MTVPPPGFLGIRHVAIKIHDIKSTVEFYVNKLGFRITRIVKPGEMAGATRHWGGCFIRCNNLHHDILLIFVEKGEAEAPTPSVLGSHHGMHHFSLEVASKKEFDAWIDYCQEEGIEIFWSPSVHSATHPEGDGYFGEHRGFFISDPSGNHIQILCDMAEINPESNGIEEKWFRDRLERDGYARDKADPPPPWKADSNILDES